MDETNQSLLQRSRAMMAEGLDTEAVLSFLRKRGLSKIESIKAIRELQGVRLSEAKGIVHLSRAWNDVQTADEAFHDAWQQATEQHNRG